MSAATPSAVWHWTNVVPLVGLVALAFSWGRTLPGVIVLLIAIVLGAAVMSAVHHAEVVAHRVGEPFGSIVLAVAVTVIEVGLIISIMLGGKGAETLARDTVFAAVMITLNGIVGLSILVGSLKHGFSRFNAEGSGGALATAIVLAVTCLVIPTFTLGQPGPQFTGPQLAFAGLSSLAIWAMFISTQTVRHRDFFLPVDKHGHPLDVDGDGHADPPTNRAALTSLALLVVALVVVVGLAKVESPAIEAAVSAAGLPKSFVGVVIAMLVLAPETLAAVNNAKRDRVQTSLNLGFGSAIASVGLTIPTLAVATIWLDVDLHLGLGAVQIVLLSMTAVVAVLTVVPGRATRLQGGVHLMILAAYLFLAANP